MMSSLFWRQLALESCEFHSKKNLLDKAVCNMFFISIFFYYFLGFNHDFISIDFTRIAASNTASDDVTN